MYCSTHYSGEQPVVLDHYDSEGEVHSITNNCLSNPLWPKQKQGIEIIKKYIDRLVEEKDPTSQANIDQTLDFLLNVGRIDTTHPDEGHTEDEASGIFVHQGYWQASPQFIHNCTLSTTAIVVRYN